ncbi:MAG: hypothetical protein LWX51_16330 [Deltaproteobacteria bacterium]|nr:hypothetical protein [Deltaproteobacteria bacterium]
MTKVIETSVSDVEKISRIYTPHNIAEETRVSGFAFTPRLAKKVGLKRKDVSRAFFEGSKVFQYADLAKELASDSDGGPTVLENSVQI